MLEKEFEYFRDHQDEIVKKYEGKYVVIKGGDILGAYDSELDAYLETEENHDPGTFLIQKAEPGEDTFTQSFNSRVVFD